MDLFTGLSKRAFILGGLIFSFALLYSNSFDPAFAASIIGSGIAAFTGALAAIAFEKKEKDRITKIEEKSRLITATLYFNNFCQQYNSHRENITLLLSNNSLMQIHTFNSKPFNIDSLSFIQDIDEELLSFLYSSISLMVQFENRLNEFNSHVNDFFKENKEFPHRETLNNLLTSLNQNENFMTLCINRLENIIESHYNQNASVPNPTPSSEDPQT